MIHIIRVTTSGSAGSATGTADSETNVRGFVEAVRIIYDGAAPATTDVTLTEVGGLGRTIITVSNTATGAVYYPTVATNDGTGSARTDYQQIYLDQSRLRVSVAQSDAIADAVTVIVQVSDW